MVSALVCTAVIAWLAQLLLGGWQIRKFNRAFEQLCQQGSVGVGRSSGRFKPRTIIALAFDEHQNVSGSLVMKGITIFAEPRSLSQLHGLNRQAIKPNVIFPRDLNCQNALSLALELKPS